MAVHLKEINQQTLPAMVYIYRWQSCMHWQLSSLPSRRYTEQTNVISWKSKQEEMWVFVIDLPCCGVFGNAIMYVQHAQQTDCEGFQSNRLEWPLAALWRQTGS